MSETPTEQIRREHEFVLMVAGAMEWEAAYIERAGAVHSERVAQMVDFSRNYSDGAHHVKEEELLFPLLEERSAAAGGTVSVLLSEHEAARDCIHNIEVALPDAATDETARATVAENLKLYAYLLPLHIGKEDSVLIPLTEDTLSFFELQELGREFTALDKQMKSTGALERYEKMARALAIPPEDE